MLPSWRHSGRGGARVGGAVEDVAVEVGLVGPNDPAWQLGSGSPSAGFFFLVLWVGLGEVVPVELASFEDSRLGFLLLEAGSRFFWTTLLMGLLRVDPSVEEESTCSAVPSLWTRTGIA